MTSIVCANSNFWRCRRRAMAITPRLGTTKKVMPNIMSVVVAIAPAMETSKRRASQ